MPAAATRQVSLSLPDYAVGLLDRAERYLVLVGGRGGTKSRSVAYNILLKVSSVPGYNAAVIREFRVTLNDGAIALLYNLAQELGIPCRKAPQSARIEFPNGNYITAFGAERNPDNLRGLESITLAWLDEASNISRISFDMLDPSMRLDGAKIVMTLNPRREDDAVYQMFVLPKERPPNCWRYRVNYGDYPEFRTAELDQARQRMADMNDPQYQHVWEGELSARVGSIFNADNIGACERFPFDKAHRVRAWDLASVKDGGDYTVGVRMSLYEGRYRIDDMVRGQWDAGEVERKVRYTTAADTMSTTVLIERGAADAGLRDQRRWAGMLAGYDFRSERPSGNKVERSRGFAAAVANGLVYREPNADWWPVMAGELAGFSEDPREMRGRHDDIVDACAAAFNCLAGYAGQELYISYEQDKYRQILADYGFGNDESMWHPLW